MTKASSQPNTPMRTNITTSIVTTLVLSREEADWLHTAMQNPLHGQDRDTESNQDSEMRRKFWEATRPNQQ